MPILGFKHKGLNQLFDSRASKLIRADIRKKCLRALDYIDVIVDPSDCQGFMAFHPLIGNRKGYFALNISANYRMTFRWIDDGVYDVDLEDYH